jgi:hypothetical protein
MPNLIYAHGRGRPTCLPLPWHRAVPPNANFSMVGIGSNTLVRPYGIGNAPRVGADPRVYPNPGIEDLPDRELPHGED